MSRQRKLTPEQLAIAKANGIDNKLVYVRLSRGWNVTDAINKPLRYYPKQIKESYEGVKTKKTYSFKLPMCYKEKFDYLVKESGKSVSEYVTDLILEKLDKEIE